MRARVAKADAPSTPAAPAVVDLPAALRILLAPLVGEALLAGAWAPAGLLLGLVALCDAAAPHWAKRCGASPEASARLDGLANVILLGCLLLALAVRLAS